MLKINQTFNCSYSVSKVIKTKKIECLKKLKNFNVFFWKSDFLQAIISRSDLA